MSEMGRCRSLREYRDQLRDEIGAAEAILAALQAQADHATAALATLHARAAAARRDRDELYDALNTIESELATRAAGSGHLPQ